jgi:hypothetical protein
MLSSRLLAVLVCTVVWIGCAHTDHTGNGLEGGSQGGSAPTPAARMVTPKTDAGHPPLAASPDELMKPDAEGKISKALVRIGFLSKEPPTPMEFLDAVKTFQRSQGLAATGFADHETLMRLGVNPKDVDKSLDTPDVKAAKANGSISK